MAGVAHDRKRSGRQYRLDQPQVIVGEAVWSVGCKGIAYAIAVGRIARRAKAHNLGEIVGRTGGGETFDYRKIELPFGTGQAAPQRRPAKTARRLNRAAAHQQRERTILQVAVIMGAPGAAFRRDAVMLAVPSEGIPTPL